ncbi:hypothetical protein AAG570_005350 [Ranatra chinensis]|uniref:Eukaryotic translation initiation factor 4G n=1 Tax=Ranatra chinensis TaxID=642074 RepID=A0ABD0Y082_9HEMI
MTITGYSSDGKASQRAKMKKNQKFKDLNRKGFEKEGSDMDAFTETALTTGEVKQQQTVQRAVSPPAQQQQQAAEPEPAVSVANSSVGATTPTVNSGSTATHVGPYVPPNRAAAAAAVTTTTVQSQPPPPSTTTLVDNHQEVAAVVAAPQPEENNEEEDEEPVEDEDQQQEETDAMVAAKNEENSKVSTGLTSDVIKTQIIERSTPAPSSAVQLKHEYKDDQWSPLNREGKKVYGRDLLIAIRSDPLSSKKPDINLDCEIFVKERDVSNNNNNTRKSSYNAGFGSLSMNMGGNSNFAPGFMRTSSSQRGGRDMTKRGSSHSGANRASSMKKGGLHMSSSLKDDIKLRETENAWKPTRMNPNNNAAQQSEEEAKTEALYKKVRGILNKLTPEKFGTLVSQVQALPIDSYERLNGVMDLVFEKAVDEPSFSKAYADMCRVIGRIQVLDNSAVANAPTEDGNASQPKQQFVHFRKLLINRCQSEFEKNKVAELDVEKRMAEIKATKDKDKRKELQLLFEEEERKIRVRSVGLVRFIGELYKLQMLTPNIMHNCVKQLISKIDEESLECLCKLLMTIGKDLEKQSQENQAHDRDWNNYFNKMAKLSVKREDSKVSSRVRFMLQDVIELREKRWVPRRNENNPKTIEQIQKEAERETLENAAILANAPRSRDNRDRDDRRRNQRGGGGQNEEGWQSVTSKFTRSYPFEVSKLQHMKNTEQESVLGSSNQFNRWGCGAGVKPTNKLFADNNTYAVLAQDERKPAPSLSLNRGPPNKITPSPSLEKERAFQGVKDVLDSGRNAKGSVSGGSGASGPPSRDHSRVRYQQQPQSRPGTEVSPPPPALQQPSTSTSMPAAPPTAPSAPAAELMPEDLLNRKTKNILEEYKTNRNIEEAIQCCKESFVGANMAEFAKTTLSLVLEQTTKARQNAADLLGQLVVRNLLQPQVIVKAFVYIFGTAEDLWIDLPFIWKYLAELLVPFFCLEVVTFADLKTMSELMQNPSYLATVLGELFRALVVEQGPIWIRTKWESSKVSFKDFMAEDKVESFFKEYNVQAIMSKDGGQVWPEHKMPLSEVEERLYKFLKSEHDRVFDQICDWLTANLGERTKERSFIRVLTHAVVKASIKNNVLVESTLQKHEKLIKRYIDNNQEDLELECLYAVQNLVVTKMEAPKGLLQSLFQSFYDNNTISYDAFLKWKNPGRTETAIEMDGKGTAVIMLSPFFVSLSEVDDGEEETS